MPATIHYIKSHFRGNRARPQSDAARYHTAVRFSTRFLIVSFVCVLLFVTVGAWLIIGVASIGRSNNDCLQGGRRVCGIFHHGDFQNARWSLANLHRSLGRNLARGKTGQAVGTANGLGSSRVTTI
jgi:hypothetical protein